MLDMLKKTWVSVSLGAGVVAVGLGMTYGDCSKAAPAVDGGTDAVVVDKKVETVPALPGAVDGGCVGSCAGKSADATPVAPESVVKGVDAAPTK